MSQVDPFERAEPAYFPTVTSVLQPQKWSVWKGKPWNPSCGLVSLETGAKVFLRGYMGITIFFIVVFLLSLISVGFTDVSSNATNVRYGHILSHGIITDIARYGTHMLHGYVIILVVAVAWMCLTAYSCYKCVKSLEEGSVAQMKIHFWVVLIFVVLDIVGGFSLKPGFGILLLVEISISSFAVIGILFTYNHILERIQNASTTVSYSRDAII